jgi:hypothetical protein
MSCPSHSDPFCFDEPDDIRWIVKPSNVLAAKFSQTSCHFLFISAPRSSFLWAEFFFWGGGGSLGICFLHLLRGRSKVYFVLAAWLWLLGQSVMIICASVFHTAVSAWCHRIT